MTERSMRGRLALLAALVAAPLVLVVIALAPAFAQVASEMQVPAGAPVADEVMKWGFMAAALVAGISALGAAYAVAVVGGAAMGAVAEKPETAGRALVFVGLAEGIAIYGLIIAIMILGYLT